MIFFSLPKVESFTTPWILLYPTYREIMSREKKLHSGYPAYAIPAAQWTIEVQLYSREGLARLGLAYYILYHLGIFHCPILHR